MTKENLLRNLSFGSVDSESEDNLDKIFIQTANFNEFLKPTTALLLGSKVQEKVHCIGFLQNMNSRREQCPVMH